jgi:hypothetical protein
MSMKIIVVVVGLILIGNVIGTVWLVQHTSTSSGQRLNEGTMAQVDKLFALMTSFQTELENVTAQANYPGDEEKETAKKSLVNHSFRYQLARLAYPGAREKRSREALLGFLSTSCGNAPWGAACQLMEPPSFKHLGSGKVVNGEYQAGEWTTYGNVSRLESQEEELNVLALSLLYEIN